MRVLDGCIPPAWSLHTLAQHSPSHCIPALHPPSMRWFLHPARRDVVLHLQEDGVTCTPYRITRTLQLMAAGSPLAVPSAQAYTFVCVWEEGHAQGGEGGEALPTTRRTPPRLWVVGPWDKVRVDPALWELAGRPLLQARVRDMVGHALVQRAQREGAAMVSGVVQPAIWGQDWEQQSHSLGLPALERVWEQPQQARPPADTASQELMASAPWLSMTPPRPRPPRGQRQLTLDTLLAPEGRMRAAPRGRRQPGLPSLAIAEQRQGGAGGPKPPWVEVWARLRALGAPPAHFLLAWQVLHGKVQCAAYLAYVQRRQGRGTAVSPACPHCMLQPGPSVSAPACAPETLTHMFMACPVVARPLVQWACALMGRVGGAAPPCTAAVLLADDVRQWDPGDDLRLAWGRIRLATLYALWGARTRALQTGQHSTPASVACHVVSSLQAQISGDWVRATTARARFEGVHRGWLEDGPATTEPVLTVEQFAARWALRGALCVVVQEGGKWVMRMRISHAWPVPLPR